MSTHADLGYDADVFGASEEFDSRPVGQAPELPTDEATKAVAADSSALVHAAYPWVGPLIEAAVLCAAEDRRPVTFYTKWCGKDGVGSLEDADEAKHAAYMTHMVQTIDSVFPWLFGLLNSSRATLLVSPGSCCFTVHTRLGHVFDIPDLIPFTHLTPFAPGEGDTIH